MADRIRATETTTRPWCCPEPRCLPLHALKDGDAPPLTEPSPGESFVCFGRAPKVAFTYDGINHANDARSCHFTPLKGLIAYQENAADWEALHRAYGRALTLLRTAERGDPSDKRAARIAPGCDDHE